MKTGRLACKRHPELARMAERVWAPKLKAYNILTLVTSFLCSGEFQPLGVLVTSWDTNPEPHSALHSRGAAGKRVAKPMLTKCLDCVCSAGDA
jgi:hypothetical protein